MIKATPDKTRRYQPRLSFDDRMGEVFEELMSLPEELRKTELTFLVQLGFLTKKSLAQSAAMSIAASLAAQAAAAGTGNNAKPSEPGLQDDQSKRPQTAEEMAGAAVATLAGWAVDDEFEAAPMFAG